MAGEKAQNTGLAGRYAVALFELALEKRALEAVSDDFATLKSLLAESIDLDRLVRAPVFSTDQQKLGMEAVLRRMAAAPLTTKFILTLATKRRLFALADVIRAFDALLSRQKGEIDAEVAAARALNEAEIVELKHALKASLGRDARLSAKVDPALLGGLVVKVGSHMIDSSLRTKLEGLHSAMRGH